MQEYIGRRIEAVITGLTRNQAGILEVGADFLTTHRQKSTVSTINICCSLLLFSPFSGEDFGGITIGSITQEVEGVALEMR